MLGFIIIAASWAAILAGVVGVIWIAILAFQDDQPIWGVASLLCFIAAVIYGVMRFDEAKIPLLLMGVAIILRAGLLVALAAVS